MPCETDKTDAPNYVCARIVSQPDNYGVLHPIAFYLKKMFPAECSYELYDKDLLVIILAFKEWQPHFDSPAEKILVLSVHKSLEYFMTTNLPNQRKPVGPSFSPGST